MFRVLAVSFSAVAAIRRGGDSRDSSPRDLLSSLLQTNKALDARALAQVVEAWTDGVDSNLTAVVASMEQEVVSGINAAHNHTVSEVNRLIEDLRSKVNISWHGKIAANNAVTAMHACAVAAKQDMMNTISAQNLYNQLVADTWHPCGMEFGTKTFTATHDPISQSCDTDTDTQCSTAYSDLADKIAQAKQDMIDDLDGDLKTHNDWTTSCTNAEGLAIAQHQRVHNNQSAWNQKHTECRGKVEERNTKVCNFGTKLQAACQAKSAYFHLKEQINGTGNVHSVSDRQAEYATVATVLCVLRDFVDSKVISDASVDACRAGIDTSHLTVDVRLGEVEIILAVNEDSSYSVTCVSGESHSFYDGSEWGKERKMPANESLPEEYTNHTIPSTENLTVTEYTYPAWTQAFSVEELPFSVCSS